MEHRRKPQPKRFAAGLAALAFAVFPAKPKLIEKTDGGRHYRLAVGNFGAVASDPARAELLELRASGSSWTRAPSRLPAPTFC